ncbi:DUF4838 domain-containing protein [Cerasicoccus maritimus]|uniref:DUF4838 domain-containing protein n=1 Tax=Cerasicoccus maritimus TaxID=490089 RepID=UPI002852ACA5|nr:DUF4838 domain-containing protein [Cerasicoccus maritimus]
MKYLWLLWVAVLCVSLLQAAPRRTPLIESVVVWADDSIIGPIYYPANVAADSPARQVAEDLGRILSIASGQEWPVLPEPSGEVVADGIFIGDTVRARVDRIHGSWDGRPVTGDSQRELLASCSWERTSILAHPRRLVINGSTPLATRSGVYRFLQESLGCAWVFPGELGERIPRQSRFTLRAGWRDLRPDFYDRKFLLGGALNPENENGLWALRNGASSHFQFNHNLHRIFSRAIMSENPDWLAWRFGRYVPLSDVRGNGSQPDLLNDKVIESAAEYVGDRQEGDADLLTVSVATNDSIRYDDSERTREFLQPFRYFRRKPNYSDLVFGFTNQVAEAAADAVHPVVVTQLAYMWTELPPSFPLAGNVMPYICTDQSQWYDTRYRREDEALIEAWSEAGPEMLGAWEYYQGQPYLIPRYFPTIEAESLEFLWRHGARGVFFSGHPVWGFDAPKYWLAGQLAWDVDQDHEELLERYFDIAYGPAGPAMSRFFAEAEEAWMTQPGDGFWLKYWNNPDQFALYPEERRQEMGLCLAQAIKAAESIEDVDHKAKVMGLIGQTEKAWLVTVAGAELYDAWLALVSEGDGEKPPQAQIDRFHDCRATWLAVDRTLLPRSPEMIKLMDGLDPLARWSASWKTVSSEDFTESIFDGDVLGAGPESVGPEKFRRGWVTTMSPSEEMSVRRLLEPSERLRVEGSDFGSIYRWLDLAAGVSGEMKVEATLRGVVSLGCIVEVVLYFMTADGKTTEPIYRDRIYPGAFPDWITLATACRIPEGARRVSVGMRVCAQQGGDWLEVQSIDLQYRKEAPTIEKL